MPPKKQDIITYPYKPVKSLTLLGGIVFFGASSWTFVIKAFENESSFKLIIIRHILEISFAPFEATLFLWIFAALNITLFLTGVFQVYEIFTSKRKIILTNLGIEVPQHSLYGNETLFIPFSDITSLVKQKVFGGWFLKVIHSKGKYVINGGMLPNQNIIDEIDKFISSAKKNSENNEEGVKSPYDAG